MIVATIGHEDYIIDSMADAETLMNIISRARPVDSHYTPSAGVLMAISDDQLVELKPVFNAQKQQGGAIIAQIWRDGIRVKLLTDAQQRQISQITGVQGDKLYGSAAACHIDALAQAALAQEAA